jgi:uncharacterized protein
MGRSVLADTGYLVALLSRRDRNHRWAAGQARRFALPWITCEAVLWEAFHVMGPAGEPKPAEFLRRGAVVPAFDLRSELEPVLKLLHKYADLPMSLADACLVRMTETQADPVILTTDADFRLYRRHSRHVVPCVLP